MRDGTGRDFQMFDYGAPVRDSDSEYTQANERVCEWCGCMRGMCMSSQGRQLAIVGVASLRARRRVGTLRAVRSLGWSGKVWSFVKSSEPSQVESFASLYVTDQIIHSNQHNMHPQVRTNVQVDPRSRCASRDRKSLCAATECSPESLLPASTMLALLPNPLHLFPVVQAHAARAWPVHLLSCAGPTRCRPLSAGSAVLALAILAVHERLRVVRVLLQRAGAVRRCPIAGYRRLAAVGIGAVTARTGCRSVWVRSNQPAVPFGARYMLLALAPARRCKWLHADLLAGATARGIVWATTAALDVRRRRRQHERRRW